MMRSGRERAGSRPVAVLGDIHGCADELERLLEVLPAAAEVVSVGDLIDKGPEPARVISILRERGARVVAGNHELAFERRLKRGEPAAVELASSLGSGGLAWLRRARFVQPVPGGIAIHGGVPLRWERLPDLDIETWRHQSARERAQRSARRRGEQR